VSLERIWRNPCVEVLALSIFLGSVTLALHAAKVYGLSSQDASQTRHHSAKCITKARLCFCGDAAGKLRNEESRFLHRYNMLRDLCVHRTTRSSAFCSKGVMLRSLCVVSIPIVLRLTCKKVHADFEGLVAFRKPTICTGRRSPSTPRLAY
jgi:hypothetical protein